MEFMDEQLLTAIAAKDLSRVEELLAAGANPNAVHRGKTAYQLVPHGADEIKCALIEVGAEDADLKQALVWVLMTGRVKAVQTLIEKGADLNVRTGCGTPIQVAASSGYTEIAELLIAAGADVDSGSSISTPLLSAIEHGHIDIALKLLAAGADPNRTSQFGNTPPIAMASAQGSTDVIRALMIAGADINTRVSHITLNRLVIQQEATAALQTAFGAMEALGRMMESLEELDDDDEVPSDRMAEMQSEIAGIEAVTAPQTMRSTEPETAVDTFPVIITARCGHAEALATLLEAGADPHRKDGEGLSAYDWAVRNEYPNVLAVLRRFGVEGTRISVDEKLLLAAEKGAVDIVQDCLRQGAAVNARDARRQTRDKTALMLAAKAGHLPVVQVLLAAGADPNLTDQGVEARPVSEALLEDIDPETLLGMGYSFGRTALMAAVVAGQTEVVQALLQAGANPNHKDAVDYTALALAVENKHLITVQALVTAGAEVNQAVTYGNTPLILACEKGAVEVAEFLLEQGANAATTNRDRETALMKAAAAGSLPLVRLCLEQGVEVNAISKERKTALACAAGASHYVEVNKDAPNASVRSYREYRDDGSCWEWGPLPETQILAIVQALLQAGADPNVDNCGTTPLIEAAKNGQLCVLEALLTAGARLEVRDSSGDTAASLAKLYNQQNVLSFLRSYTGTDLSEFETCEAEADQDDGDDQERWGEELPQPDFSEAAQNSDYQQAVNELAELCGGTPISHGNAPGWFSIHVNSKRRLDIDIETLQQQFLERACFVYEPDRYYGNGPKKLCILPTTDKYEVIAWHQTNGCNYGIGPGYVVQWLRELEAEQSFILTCIAHDTLAGRFLTPIADPEELAERMYDFCPDIVDQGCGSVEILAESLSSSDHLFFWWD